MATCSVCKLHLLLLVVEGVSASASFARLSGVPVKLARTTSRKSKPCFAGCYLVSLLQDQPKKVSGAAGMASCANTTR